MHTKLKGLAGKSLGSSWFRLVSRDSSVGERFAAEILSGGLLAPNHIISFESCKRSWCGVNAHSTAAHLHIGLYVCMYSMSIPSLRVFVEREKWPAIV